MADARVKIAKNKAGLGANHKYS